MLSPISGTTTEPAVAFRIFKTWMEQKYGKEGARERIYATTDKERGALKKLADEEGYETFVVPDDIGGRYSVLTAVGLLPSQLPVSTFARSCAVQRMV
jgi:glucose-6-phosphate isomerase